MYGSTALTENGVYPHQSFSVYKTKDLEHFEEPVVVLDSASEGIWAKDHYWAPEVHFYNGKYYLIFSLKTKAHYMVSDKPFEGFVMPEDPIVPCASVPKCAEWDGKLIFAGFKRMGGYGGSLTFKTATGDEKGELIFGDLTI